MKTARKVTLSMGMATLMALAIWPPNVLITAGWVAVAFCWVGVSHFSDHPHPRHVPAQGRRNR